MTLSERIAAEAKEGELLWREHGVDATFERLLLVWDASTMETNGCESASDVVARLRLLKAYADFWTRCLLVTCAFGVCLRLSAHDAENPLRCLGQHTAVPSRGRPRKRHVRLPDSRWGLGTR